MKKPKQGVNPVTIRPKSPTALRVSIARLWIVKPDGNTEKRLTVMMWDESKPIDQQTPAATILDEDTFIDALGYLFPKGELSDAHLTDSATP